MARSLGSICEARARPAPPYGEAQTSRPENNQKSMDLVGLLFGGPFSTKPTVIDRGWFEALRRQRTALILDSGPLKHGTLDWAVVSTLEKPPAGRYVRAQG